MEMTKNPTMVNYRRFSCYKPTIVFHVFLENNRCEKSNSPQTKDKSPNTRTKAQSASWFVSHTQED